MNVLFIFSDQQNRYALGCMGNPNVETPNLDGIWVATATSRFRKSFAAGIDMMPTCLDVAGLPQVSSVDGKSFAPVLRGEIEAGGEAIFSECRKWCMVVRGYWKLVAERTADGLQPTMLIDLKNDPYEFENRVLDPALADLRTRLLADLTAWNSWVPYASR